MAEKTLNTRIINKNADLSTWNSSNLALKTGEIALARVEATKPDGHGGYYKVPTYLMKVGDGNKTFSQLEWVAAPASDVYDWAKKSAMAAADMPVLTETDAARIAPTIIASISALEEAIGNDGTVAEMITAAIEELDVTDTAVTHQVVTAVSQEDGKISVSRAQLAVADISGLQAALDAKLDVSTYNTDKAALEQSISTNAGAITAEAEARAAADEALQANIDLKASQADHNTLAGRVTTVEGAAADAQADATLALNTIGGEYDEENTVAADIAAVKTSVTNEATARSEADAAQVERIAALEGKIVDLTGAMHFRGVLSELPTDLSGYVEGDVIIVGNKEYVLEINDETEVKRFVEFGDVTDEASRIGELETAVAGLGNTKADKTYVDEQDQALQANINLKADASVVNELDGKVTGIDTRLGTAEGTITDHGTRLTAVETKAGDNESAITALQSNSATKTELSEAQAALQANIDLKASQADHNTLAGRVTTAEGTITDHGTRLTDVETKANDNATAISGLQTSVSNVYTKTEIDGKVGTINEAITAEQNARSQADEKHTSDIAALVGRMDTAEAGIAANLASIGTINATLATKADASALEAVGNRVAAIEADYLTAADTYIFDCGGAE